MNIGALQGLDVFLWRGETSQGDWDGTARENKKMKSVVAWKPSEKSVSRSREEIQVLLIVNDSKMRIENY